MLVTWAGFIEFLEAHDCELIDETDGVIQSIGGRATDVFVGLTQIKNWMTF